MTSLERRSGSDPASCLIVFLPGAGDTARHYVDHGFTAQVVRSQIHADMAAFNTTLAHYREDSFAARVRDEVLFPARNRGYEHVWLVGISMGGGGALRTAAAHPGLVDGVVLIAPFLGSLGLVREIAMRGGPRYWEATADIRRRSVYAHAWEWAGHPRKPSGQAVPLHLGFGTEDLLAPVAETLAMALPTSHVIRGGGGHNWRVWSDLWRGFTESGFLQRTCGTTSPR